MTSVAPDAALTSPTNNWGVYYTYAVQCVLDGKAIDTDWCKGFSEDAVRITPVNEAVAAEGTPAVSHADGAPVVSACWLISTQLSAIS